MPGENGLDGQDGQDGAPGPGLTAIEGLTGLPCRVGQPDEGVVEVGYEPSSGTTRGIELGCRASTLHTLTVTRTGQGTIAGGAISCGDTCSAQFALGPRWS